jgi:glycosyltransferase involved in cell wall biosynthesis
MPTLPKVTIAIPTYNRVGYLGQAIESALAQTYPNLEVIVSDNCSSDGTYGLVSAMGDSRIVLLRQEKNLGMIGNWNACLERATGEMFLLLSDDDYLEKQAIEKMVGAWLGCAQPERVGMVYCRTWEVDQHNRKLNIDPSPQSCEEARDFALQFFAGKRRVHTCSALLRTGDLRQVGGYTQNSVAFAVDAVAWSRIVLKRGCIMGVADPLSSYRIHPSRTTSSSLAKVWQNDIARLIDVWSEAFRDSPAKVRRRFRRAVRYYESWEMAAIINGAFGAPRGRIRTLATYCSCLKSFAGLAGVLNLLRGVAKLLTPEALKRPIRSLLLRVQEPSF